LLSRRDSFFFRRREGGAWSVEGKAETDEDKGNREEKNTLTKINEGVAHADRSKAYSTVVCNESQNGFKSSSSNAAFH
jgi:hypothetical protein